VCAQHCRTMGCSIFTQPHRAQRCAREHTRHMDGGVCGRAVRLSRTARSS
jgi:hypothetical protein